MNGSEMRYPLAENAALYDPVQVDDYISRLFAKVEWQQGQVISLLGIGEKGTPKEGVVRERKIISPDSCEAAHVHLERWAGFHTAGFIVPAVLNANAAGGGKGSGALDKVDALTAIILDLDSGDVSAKAAYATERLGTPSMVVASGGKTEAGKFKAHIYWLFNEPCKDVERVAALRKTLAAKVGGDQSFGRATQVVRVPGTVHAKFGEATVCRFLARNDVDYSLDDLEDIILDMQPMPGLPAPVKDASSSLTLPNGMMDFSPRQDTAVAALHRDISAGGEDLNRWTEFSKVAGFHIAEARAGRITPADAYHKTQGWMLTHMQPPWPDARFEQEFRALFNKDVAKYGAMPESTNMKLIAGPNEPLPIEYFADIQASLSNAWLVRNLLPLTGLGLIYGSPGAGKSFFTIDIALRIAAGWDVDGRVVQQRPVVYVGAEGQNGLRARVAAWRKHHSIGVVLPFALIPCAVNLLDPNADLNRLADAIRSATERFGSAPGLIVIDTLAATFGGGDENTTAMVGYVNNLAKLRDAFHSLVLAVHHRPKDQLNDTPRGHSSLMGAMDTIIRVDGKEMRMAAITKQKDAEAGPAILFNLVSVKLGVDDDGEPVFAAVVEHQKIPTGKLSKQARAILTALENAITDAGGAAVLEADWRRKWEETVPPTMEEEARRKAWQRARKALQQLGKIQNEEGLWLLSALDDAPRSTDVPLGMDFRPRHKAA